MGSRIFGGLTLDRNSHMNEQVSEAHGLKATPHEIWSMRVVKALLSFTKAHNLSKTDEELKRIFKKRRISTELRIIDSEDDKNSPGTILYYLTLSLDISTDRLSEEIFSPDSRNINSIKWEQKKSLSYIYR